MSRRPSFQQHTVRWMVLLALVFAALAPGLSHAFSGARAGNGDVNELAPWLELCSSKNASEDGVPSAYEHCAYCLVQPPLGVPPAPGPLVPLERAHHEVPQRASPAPHAGREAPLVLARGPPAFG